METEHVLFCSGQAADCSTIVEKLIGRGFPSVARLSWNAVMVSVLSRMSTTIRCSRAVYSYPHACWGGVEGGVKRKGTSAMIFSP